MPIAIEDLIAIQSCFSIGSTCMSFVLSSLNLSWHFLIFFLNKTTINCLLKAKRSQNCFCRIKHHFSVFIIIIIQISVHPSDTCQYPAQAVWRIIRACLWWSSPVIVLSIALVARAPLTQADSRNLIESQLNKWVHKKLSAFIIIIQDATLHPMVTAYNDSI